MEHNRTFPRFSQLKLLDEAPVLILFGSVIAEVIEANLAERDDTWKDRQIFSPRAQPASGGADNWKVDPNQKLARLDYEALRAKPGAKPGKGPGGDR